MIASIGTLTHQNEAVNIVENELNSAKKRLEFLESEKNNKIRLVEINNYYSDKYTEHTQLIKIIIYTLIPCIILTFLNKRNLLPNNIYYILLLIIFVICIYFFFMKFVYVMMRDNMNYQKYDWYFTPTTTNTQTTISSSTLADPWLVSIPGTCIGKECCSKGQIWNPSINQCSGSSTESFLTNVLTKQEPGKFKSDVNMGNIQYNQSKKFH